MKGKQPSIKKVVKKASSQKKVVKPRPVGRPKSKSQ